jgi:2-methylisocitrate lyase-like PEP mutase family enzyme
MPTQVEKAAKFVALHERDGAFVIPNPWDLGSAHMFAGLGFEALATTSFGFAITLGRMDGEVTLEETIAHCRTLCEGTSLPVSGDLENCFADDPDTAAETIRRAAEAGLVGGSIEDFCPDDGGRIYDLQHSVERVQAAVEASREFEFPFLLTARAENLIRGVNDLDDTIRRLQAFEAAGAPIVYAPGLKTIEEVKLVTESVSVPVNVLAPPLRKFSVAEMAANGAKRISIGGALARTVVTTVVAAGREMLEAGTFKWSAEMAPADVLATLFSRSSQDAD